MKKNALLATGLLTILLTACGSGEPEAVVEQIVIREPGETIAAVSEAQSDAAPAQVDLVSLGEDAFQMCTGCHNIDAGGPNMSGPNLYGVVGRKAGSVEGFDYSDGMAGLGTAWDVASLDRFLANPAGYVDGTYMVAGAVRDGEQRAAIIAYLASTSE